jgi:uncharacterized protein
MPPLTPPQLAAARALISAVLREVPARLVQASLFGSRARGDARADSDVDILFVFGRLPPDREPQATQVEELAERVAEHTGVPVTAWSVSLADLHEGVRTPMLVDALTDAVPLWYAARPLPRLPYTPRDAVWCTERLLDRIEEGGTEVARRLRAGDGPAATRRLRDDLVRLCTALHLLRGETRPRRADAVRGVLRSRRWDPATREALRWAARSFGVDGRDDEAVPRPPDGGVGLLIAAVIRLRELVEEDLWRLRSRDPVGT